MVDNDETLAYLLTRTLDDELRGALLRATQLWGDDLNDAIRTNLRVGLIVNGFLPHPKFPPLVPPMSKQEAQKLNGVAQHGPQ